MKERGIRERVHRVFHYFSFIDAIKIIFNYTFRSFLFKFFTLSSNSLVKINGMHMKILPGDKGISTELFFFKGHEPLTTKILSNELKKGMNCLDVGSNIGYYVLLEAKIVGKNGRVIAIEPSLQNFKILQENVTLQKFSNVRVFHFACGNRDGNGNFLTFDRSNWSRIDEKFFKALSSNKIVSSEKIEIKKIDSFIEQIGIKKLDIIRMDIDGYEYMVLDGMIHTLKKFKPTLIIETHRAIMGLSKTKEFLKKLDDLSYEAQCYIPRDLDFSLIANLKQIEKFSISEVCQKMEQNLIPDTFTLVLKSQSDLAKLES